MSIPLDQVLWLAGALFAIGAVGILVRRNVLFMLVCAEIMMNAAALALVAIGQAKGAADGQAMFLFILAMSAAEVGLGLVLVLQIWRHFQTLDSSELQTLQD